METLSTSPPVAKLPRRVSRGRVIAFLSAAAAVLVLGAAAWTQWFVAVEEWYLYRWRRGDAPEKQSSLRTLVEAGSVRALSCLETERILYLVDVGGRERARRSGARALDEVRRHLQALSENQKFAILWMGAGVSVFPPLEPGKAAPGAADATAETKGRALEFLEEHWAAGAPPEEPCVRWALLTATAVAGRPTAKDEADACYVYFGSGPASVHCAYCPGHVASELLGKMSVKPPAIHCFAVPAPGGEEGLAFLKELASITGGLYVPLRR